MCLLQLLCGRFEDFIKQLAVGQERLEVCMELADRLTDGRHPHSSLVRRTQKRLRYPQPPAPYWSINLDHLAI